MQIFELSATITVSCRTSVEAETLEEAISIAEFRSNMNIPYGMGSIEEEWIVDELDGTPSNIELDE